MTPNPDAVNSRQMNVTVSAPVETFFMRVFGHNSIQATRRAKAEYVLPVPMGSPQAYYGINQLQRASGAPLPVQRPFGTAVNLAPQGFWGGIITKDPLRLDDARLADERTVRLGSGVPRPRPTVLEDLGSPRP